MTNETFKKLEKETSRREKRQKKPARLMERRNERARTGNELQEEQPKTKASVSRPESQELRPTYLSCLIRPRDPKKKPRSHCTLLENNDTLLRRNTEAL